MASVDNKGIEPFSLFRLQPYRLTHALNLHRGDLSFFYRKNRRLKQILISLNERCILSCY